MQSASSPHFLPTPHGTHDPPQSISVSSPLCWAFVHMAEVEDGVGANVRVVGNIEGRTVGDVDDVDGVRVDLKIDEINTGRKVGETVGGSVGDVSVGLRVGYPVGYKVGEDGTAVGTTVGDGDGTSVGTNVTQTLDAAQLPSRQSRSVLQS